GVVGDVKGRRRGIGDGRRARRGQCRRGGQRSRGSERRWAGSRRVGGRLNVKRVARSSRQAGDRLRAPGGLGLPDGRGAGAAVGLHVLVAEGSAIDAEREEGTARISGVVGDVQRAWGRAADRRRGRSGHAGGRGQRGAGTKGRGAAPRRIIGRLNGERIGG